MKSNAICFVLIFACLDVWCIGERYTGNTEKITYLSIKQENSCKANVQGYGVINLQPLDNLVNKSTKPRFSAVYRQVTDPFAESYNYSFNPCSSFNEPSNPHDRKSFGDECFHVALCKFNKDNRRYYYYPYGIHKTATFVAILVNDSDSPKVTIIYNGTGSYLDDLKIKLFQIRMYEDNKTDLDSSVAMKTSYIHLKCNRSLYSAEEAQFIITNDNERTGITAELHHLCCCLGACENGLPVEEGTKMDPDTSKLLVIMAVNLGVLVLAGVIGFMCYMKRTHLQFYSKLPGVQAPPSIHYPLESIIEDGMASNGSCARPSAYRDYEAESSRIKKKFLIPILDDCVIPSSDLELAQRLGGGVFGDTHVGKWKSLKVAITRIILNIHEKQLGPEILENMKDEVWFLSRQRHRNIVPMLGLCIEKKLPYIISEFVEGQSVKFFIQNKSQLVTWPLRLKICLQAADGMAYLHSTNPTILHRDLRCANIFISDHDIVKVGDFGLVKLTQSLREVCKEKDCCCHGDYSACPMSIRWTAPEVLKHPTSVESDGFISTMSDVYSFGMVMLELYTSEDPYDELGMEQEVIDAVISGKLPEVPAPLEMLPQYKILMKQCWDKTPEDRPKFKQIATRLKELIPQARNFQKALSSRQKIQRLQIKGDIKQV